MYEFNELLENVKTFNKEKAKQQIVRFIQQKMGEAKARGAVIGLSGGVDSALTLVLTSEAIGNENITVLIMPHASLTPQEDVEDAKRLVEKLGIENVIEIPIDELSQLYKIKLQEKGIELDKYSHGNLLARTRMTLLYAVANQKKYMVIGTGDKSEILIGYFTKYGDGGADILPIGDLYKTRVRELAKFVGVPENIAYKPSSPRLWEDHLAEKELGVTYNEVDVILYAFLDLRLKIEDLYKIEGLKPKAVKLVLTKVYKNEHKRMTPPIPKLFGGLTVGIDWRAPHYYELNL